MDALSATTAPSTRATPKAGPLRRPKNPHPSRPPSVAAPRKVSKPKCSIPRKFKPGFLRRWETKNRYFEVRVEEDMFETAILTAINGGKGARNGMVRVVAAGQQIAETLRDIQKRRLAHGYVQVI